MSRGRYGNVAYVEADSVDQAVEDLRRSWRREDRELFVTDTERPLSDVLDRLEAANRDRLDDGPRRVDARPPAPCHGAAAPSARPTDQASSAETKNRKESLFKRAPSAVEGVNASAALAQPVHTCDCA